MFYEIRRYQIQPGRRDEWVRYMEETVIPFQAEKGMSVTASFVDEEDPDGYVWIRRFEDEQERTALYADVYQSDRWRAELDPKVKSFVLVDQIKVTRVVPTSKSALR
ncbi:NIPSNAP family containing protein [Amycolatopsis rhizosphaerae]|uniref:NIPSNAP family containing protein n=1 Tax=Amycolatopsis rhizosphaerae TaxID=2053003 RepID=A0A558BGH2_9PSEU|nr:NIPSNAP family protein [Amycolatopsis rhizosphaerae]TVT35606.1 NIPSNAP family containing protein [Amycolatopsis rhizosphaerae]